MKILLCAVLATLSFQVLSNTSNLEDQKTLTNNAIDGAITLLQEQKPCVNKADSIDTLKRCKTQLQQEMTAMRDSIGETRKEVKKYHKKKESGTL